MRVFGLVGFPLGHSLSPDYFNGRFRESGMEDTVYKLFPLPSEQEIPRLIRNTPSLAGFNVTIPFKEKIIRFLDETDPLAAETGSVNVVMIDRSHSQVILTGYNTDAPAFEATLPQPLPHTRALILGTGGSSRSVAYVLNKLGIGFLFVSRHPVRPDSLTYYDLRSDPSLLRTHTLIINTTPVGMFPDAGYSPDIPYELLTPGHLLYDLVYNPEQTAFLQNGAVHGARTQQGTEMFRLQASLSFDLFMKKR